MDYNDLFMNQDLSSAEKVSWYVLRVANAFQDLLARAEAAEARAEKAERERDAAVKTTTQIVSEEIYPCEACGNQKCPCFRPQKHCLSFKYDEAKEE